MNLADFIDTAKKALPIGTKLSNPGGGTTVIVAYMNDKLIYQRANSKIYVSLFDFFNVYAHFQVSELISSTQLKDFAPSIFDSKSGGHSCNCTVLFMLLISMGLASNIEGRGVRGDPFRVTI